MKKVVLLLSIAVACNMMLAQATKPMKVDAAKLKTFGYRTATNNAFKAGEFVKYRIHYGMIDAGEATLKVEESKYKFGDREAFHIVGEGKTLGSFDWFFKVRDHYETYIDKQGIFPHRFIRNCDEGGYKIFQDYTFIPDKRAYKDAKGDAYITPEFVQDMLSSYYYARTMDFSNAKKGDVFTIMTLVDDELFPLGMKYLGKEQVKVDAGTFNCLKFAPVVQKGRIFKKEEDLTVWITDDANHLPVLAKAKILVGSIKMELKEYSGLMTTPATVN
ncbi:MAG: DUF3108 domain-containing protein [Flavobacteriales bacterium]